MAEFPRSMLNVGTGNYAVSMDEVGSERRNNQGALIPGVAKGGACVGFNASRQPDADIACDANAAGSRNGGALIWAEDEGTLNFTAFPTNKGTQVTGAVGTQWYHPDDVASYRVMKIMPAATGQTAQPTGGRVQIGRYEPTYHPDYRLAVDGKLVAQSIFVTQVNNWADFVFAPTYALQPLPELEAYLKQNRHLPAIPSAAEVEKNGIDVGEMNARLLQSLEELTLHVIELNKQNARLQAEVAALAAKMNQNAAPAVGK
ncbi:hypothetical protein KCG47_15745 [Microvirga sp. SRT04]|nr:hypothetical protein [Microvirga sp. SRT04]